MAISASLLNFIVTDRPREGAAHLLGDWLSEYKERPVLLLLSGGSALSFLDLVEVPEGMRLTLGMLDERVSSDPAVNNFLQLSATTFFKKAVLGGAQALASVPSPEEHFLELASRMEAQVFSWIQKNRKGVVLVTQGIGVDGHTAGMLPLPHNEKLFQELFIETERLFVGYDASQETVSTFETRVTATVPFLIHMVERSLVFVTGLEKTPVLKKLRESGLLHAFPARVLHDMKNVAIVTDQAVC